MMTCRKCGHVWAAVVAKPLKCPACNQPRYWLPKVRNVGGRPLTKEQVDSPAFGTPAPRSKVSPQVAGVGVLEGSSPVPGEPQGSDVSLGKSCRACEEPMKAVKGKWVCSEQTCSLLGQAQGDAR